MGTKDLFDLFNEERTKKFKVSVVISYALFIIMLGLYIHAIYEINNNSTYDLGIYRTITFITFSIGLVTFIVRNFSKHKFGKALLYILLKTFVLFIAAFFFYGLQIQAFITHIVVPGIPTSDILFLNGSLVSVTFIKLILG